MAKTVLFTWECGAGLGHLMQLRSIAVELQRGGASVVVAARDIARAGSVFADDQVGLLPAPFKIGRPDNPSPPPCTFAHVLYNVGWDDDLSLGGLVDAWKTLFDLVRPDVIVYDHSPTALLASRGMPARRVVIGSGFCCPPDQSPLPNLRFWQAADPLGLAADEAIILRRANRVLAKRELPLLDRIGQLFSEIDETLLTTFKELDHYPDRWGNPRYFGIPSDRPGKTPRWPCGTGKRVYAYLKPCATLPHLLIRLKGLGCPTLIFADSIEAKVREQFTCKTMRFETQRPDMRAVATESDLAILNANHATTASLLLAGRPLLLLPLFLEQQLLSSRVRRLGAALEAAVNQPSEIVTQLEHLLEDHNHVRAAQAFAEAHRGFDPITQTDEMVARIQRLF